MHILVVYIPESHVEKVKEALFSAKAGQYGKYDRCCWQALGLGQFRPLEGSRPFTGRPGVLKSVKEYRLEMIVKDQHIPEVLRALFKAHPYEEPAYHLIPVKTFENFKKKTKN